jgi:hypothetical protein
MVSLPFVTPSLASRMLPNELPDIVAMIVSSRAIARCDVVHGMEMPWRCCAAAIMQATWQADARITQRRRCRVDAA